MIVSPHVPGYPFIDPGPVGGVGTNTSLVPDFELYLRWWQLATFLPMVHFLTPPPPAMEWTDIYPAERKLRKMKRMPKEKPFKISQVVYKICPTMGFLSGI